MYGALDVVIRAAQLPGQHAAGRITAYPLPRSLAPEIVDVGEGMQ